MGGRGGKGDLEKSRFDWVFLNDGVPNLDKLSLDLKDLVFFWITNHQVKALAPVIAPNAGITPAASKGDVHPCIAT